MAIEALYDAADDDSATGGPDLTRGIYPIVALATAGGVRMLGDEAVGDAVRQVVDGRQRRPDGPQARLEGDSE